MAINKLPTDTSQTSETPTRRRAHGGALFNASPFNRFAFNQAPTYIEAGASSARITPESLSSEGSDVSSPPKMYKVVSDSGAALETNSEIVTGVQREGNNPTLLSTTGVFEPPHPLRASSGAQLSARAQLTLTPEPVTVVPTPYPKDPAAPLVVHGSIRIDIRSAEFVEFDAKIDRLIELLTQSNEIAGDTRDQLLAEIKAGRSILLAPSADGNLVKVLLEQPLLWIATAAGSGIIGELAYDAVQLLYHMLSHAPTVPL
jgi:hypothetical protein